MTKEKKPKKKKRDYRVTFVSWSGRGSKKKKRDIEVKEICAGDKSLPKHIRDSIRDANNLPTEEAEHHSLFIERLTQEGKRRAHNLTENNLDVYLRRRHITYEQHCAALRLFRDFYCSHLLSGYKSCLNVTIGGRGEKIDGVNHHAYESFLAALNCIVGKRAQKLMFNVCCMGEWLKDVNNVAIAPHKRMDVFQRALDELIAHYDRRFSPRKILSSFVRITKENAENFPV